MKTWDEFKRSAEQVFRENGYSESQSVMLADMLHILRITYGLGKDEAEQEKMLEFFSTDSSVRTFVQELPALLPVFVNYREMDEGPEKDALEKKLKVMMAPILEE